MNDTSLKKFLYDKTRRKTGNHLEHIRSYVRSAPEKMTEEILYDIGRLELIGDLRHPPSHVLLIDVILMFQIPYGLS
jgi:hypothetical protein